VVEKIATFPRFSEILKEHLETNETKFLRRIKREHLRFLELKSSKVFTETDKRGDTTVNVKLTIQSAQILYSVKFNTKTRNGWNRYL